MKTKQIVFSILLSVLVFQSEAQSILDSLYTVWEDPSVQDTTRAKAFTDYIYEGTFRTDPDSAVLLADQLLTFTKSIGFTIGSVDALELKGHAFFRVGEYFKALDAYQEGLDLAKSINDTSGMANILMRMGYIYHDNADIETAMSLYERSLSLFIQIDEKDGISSIYNEFGSIYMNESNFDKSLEYYDKAIAICDEIDDKFAKSAPLTNSGQVYLYQGKYEKALKNFQEGLKLMEELGDQVEIASALAGIADVNLMQGNFEEALKYLEKSMAISEEINDLRGLTSTYQALSELYSELGDFSKAASLCKRSLDLAKALGDVDHQEAACYCLYGAYADQENYKEALVYLEQVLLLTDSMMAQMSSKKLQQMEFSKQVLQDSIATAERERKAEMAYQNEINASKRTRNIGFGIGVIVVIIALSLFSRLRYVKKSKAVLQIEKDRSENLLLNILPEEIAQELKEKGKANARDFDMVSILFSDFIGFTQASAKLSAKVLVAEINTYFEAFDGIMEKYNIEKIKTIGDAYMAAGGLPVPTEDSVKRTILAALEMQQFMFTRKTQMDSADKLAFEMRVGVHTGPVVAGIVGVKKFQYDIWGDTVNTASRLESNGEVGKVNISQGTFELLKEDPDFIFESRGKIQAKGKGEIEMYFVTKKEGLDDLAKA